MPSRAVISAPLRPAASITITASASAATMRLRSGNRNGAGGVPGGYSDSTAPCTAMRAASAEVAAG